MGEVLRFVSVGARSTFWGIGSVAILDAGMVTMSNATLRGDLHAIRPWLECAFW